MKHDIKTLDGGGVKGSLLKIGPEADLEIYLTTPSTTTTNDTTSSAANDEKKKALVVFTDVYGLQNRLFAICDKLASDLNMIVVAIDTFRGETKAHHTDDFVEWIKCHPFIVDDGDITAAANKDYGDGKPTTVFPVKKDIELASPSYWKLMVSTHQTLAQLVSVGVSGLWSNHVK